jgi:hypothetical protein
MNPLKIQRSIFTLNIIANSASLLPYDLFVDLDVVVVMVVVGGVDESVDELVCSEVFVLGIHVLTSSIEMAFPAIDTTLYANIREYIKIGFIYLICIFYFHQCGK